MRYPIDMYTVIVPPDVHKFSSNMLFCKTINVVAAFVCWIARLLFSSSLPSIRMTTCSYKKILHDNANTLQRNLEQQRLIQRRKQSSMSFDRGANDFFCKLWIRRLCSLCKGHPILYKSRIKPSPSSGVSLVANNNPHHKLGFSEIHNGILCILLLIRYNECQIPSPITGETDCLCLRAHRYEELQSSITVSKVVDTPLVPASSGHIKSTGLSATR